MRSNAIRSLTLLTATVATAAAESTVSLFLPHLPRKWNSYSSQLCFKNISNVDCLGRRGAALESETRLLLGSPDLARKEAINPFRAQQTKTW